MYKSKLNSKSKCIHCMEEIKKADLSRKYAHELKNIFITISTVVNSEIENQHQNYNPVSNNTSLICESGEFSPYIMDKSRPRQINKEIKNENISSTHSPFDFLKTLCDYGKTLIKEINDMGKDLVSNEKVEYFNVSKAINFCVDMFETKKFYDKAKKNLEIYSDINFSFNKEVNSISETGFKMVLINLLTNSYKFTIKGHIVVRAVSIPKEKKIRILVKDSGKGFNPKEFKKNGCFYVYERNQELNADGSGLGLRIVNEILTKFNIKLDCISDSEKGGSLFYFDIADSFPYYDEVYPQNLMTTSLNKMINDINNGKQEKNATFSKKMSFKKNQRKSMINNNNNKNHFQITLNKVENNQRHSFMEDNSIINSKNLAINDKNIYKQNTRNNNKSKKNSNLFYTENIEKKRKSFGNFLREKDNFEKINITPNKNKIGRFFSLENSDFKIHLNSFKKNGQSTLLRQIIEDNMNRNRAYNDKDNDKNKKRKDKNIVNYKNLLNKNFNKSKFYFMDIKNIFLKNEIYINLYLKSFKRSITEIGTPKNNDNNKKKGIQPYHKDKIYIIICDDEEFVAMSAKELIIKYYIKKGKDPHIYFTPNGIECIYLMYKLFIIENKKIEYILLDMEMPYLNGIKTCNIIKSIKGTNIPIYILSGDEPKDCSADGYCNKPLNEIDIINKLDKKK